MGTNITEFQPEIFAKIRPVKQQHEESTSDLPEVDGSALRTLGSAEVWINKSGYMTGFMTAFVIKYLPTTNPFKTTSLRVGNHPSRISLCSTQYEVNFRGKSIKKLEEALRQAWAKWGLYVRSASTSRIVLGLWSELDKISNEYPEVLDNMRILMINGRSHTIKLEETAVPFNKGFSRFVLSGEAEERT